MKRRNDRTDRGDTIATRQVGLDSMQGRVLLGLLVVALVPAFVGVALASVLVNGSDPAAASDQARRTSAAATDLLLRAQAIEARLAALASDAGLNRVNSTANSANRQLARRSMNALQGRDGSIVAGACVTRVSDGRLTVIAEDRELLDSGATCATGTLLAAAADAAGGTIVRSLAPDAGALLVASPIAGRGGGTEAVLTAAIDLERLLARTPATARSEATSIVVDTDSSDLVAGRGGGHKSDAASAGPLDPRTLSMYAGGILSGYPATLDSLARAGFAAQVAELWPTTDAAALGLIQAWPTPPTGAGAAAWLVLAVVGIVALTGVLVLMRLLIKPFRDLHDSQSQLETLYREAREDSLHDGLTGMGNHRAFQDELANQLELSERDGTPFALMLIDLDNLKVVNDREGHAEGDRLLTGLSTAMRRSLRQVDRLFRIGGDEFAVIMPGTEPEEAAEAAGRLRHYCLRPPSGERPTPFSGGISSIPRFALEASQVQRQADTALYWAKRHGRGFVEIFDPERDHVPEEQGTSGLGNAVYEIARDRLFKPVYQPIVDLRSGRVVGFEGLVRPDPDGPIPDSGRLFEAAAATGRTVELDLACFETVTAGARDIGSDHIISINLSAKTLEVKDFDSSWLLNTLVRNGISPSRVIVELTERDPIVDVKRLQNNVRHLGEYGLRLAADDVGAGSAGLRMLAEIPFDIVKIDLGLVRAGAQQAASWEVLRSIRDLAWRQRSVVIGEGVETPQQLKALQELEIRIGQGYLLGRPESEPDTRPRDLARLALAASADPVAPPPDRDEGAEPPVPPELVIDQLGPRPIPVQLQSLPASQLQPAG
jgi:diguanylate cyclase (GGDEF)-like protein